MSRAAPRRWGALLVAMVGAHVLLWWAIGRARGVPLEGTLQHFDAGWYSLIVGEGYTRDPRCWVFYPLYPLAVRALVAASGLWPWQATVGAVFSTVCLAVACRIAEGARTADPAGEHAGILYPRTSWGHAVLLLSPASFALHSHHTEGLFLALSLGAFALAGRDRPRLAAMLAGLSALTRTQGVIAAVCVGLWAARRKRGGPALAALAVSAAISGTMYAAWPLYQWRMTGNPSIAVEMPRHWGLVVPWDVVVSSVLLRGADQHADVPTLARYAAFLLALGTSAGIARRNWMVGLYLVLSLLANPLRGAPTYSAFRYLCVLFPVLFTWGDAIAQRGWTVRVAAGGLLVAANLQLAANYGFGIEAY